MNHFKSIIKTKPLSLFQKSTGYFLYDIPYIFIEKKIAFSRSSLKLIKYIKNIKTLYNCIIENLIQNLTNLKIFSQKILLTIVSLLLLFSCKTRNEDISLLTNDPYIVDAVIAFNSTNPTKKIKPLLLNNNLSNLFSTTIQQNIDRYDIIAGSFIPSNYTNFDLFNRIDIIYDKSTYIPLVNDFYNQTNHKAFIYKSDFPVIVTNKTNKIVNNPLLLDDLKKESDNEIKLYRESNINNKFSFIPELSDLSDLEFYLINENLFLTDEKMNNFFNSKGLSSNYNYYNNFNNSEDDNENISKVINKYLREPEKFLIERNLIAYDFKYISNSLLSNKTKLIFIKDLKTASLKQSIITVSKRSKFNKESQNFIEFLLTEKCQIKLFNESIKRNDVYNSIFLPVLSNNKVISEKLPAEGEKIVNILNSVNYNYLGNAKNRKQFFKLFNIASDMVGKERLKKEDFINFIEKNLK